MVEHLADKHSTVANDSRLDLIPIPDTTIADLPNELLAHVFIFNSLQNFQHLHNPAQTIRRASQVCRRWRAIALNTPRLWAHIFDPESRSKWIEEVIDRSRAVPLDLVFPSITKDLMDESWAPTMLEKSLSFELIDLVANPAPKVWHSFWFLLNQELLQKFLPKTRSILLSVSSSTWSTFLRPLVISYLPNLERLSLVARGSESGLFGHGGQLAGGPPWNLRSLNLRKCNFLFDGLSLPCLEELTIHHVPAAHALPPLTWLTILENLPKLKRLELVNVTATRFWITQGENEEFSPFRRMVRLPDMQWLRLSLPLPHCTNILNNLVIPLSCKLDLTTDASSSLREEFYALVDILEQKFDAAEDGALGDSLRLSISPNTFVVHAYGEKDCYAGMDSCPLFNLSMTWKTAFDDASVPPSTVINPFTVFCAMAAALKKPCVSVTRLRIDLDVTAEPKEQIRVLAELFSNFNNVKHLHHISPSTLPFLLNYFDFLSRRNRMVVGSSEADYSTLLPLMDSMSFQNVNFASLHPSNPNLLKNLHGFVTIRLADLDVSPIKRLTFENCRAMSKNGINRLVNVGVHINLDESTCKNCDTRGGGPPYYEGWRRILPFEQVEWELS